MILFGFLTAEIADLSIEEDARMEFSAWLRAADGVESSVNYRIYQENTVLAEGVWNVSEAWQQQTASCNVSAGTGNYQIVLSAGDGVCYVDDLDAAVKALPAADLSFKEIFSDGTWRFLTDDFSLFTEKYYKIPAVVDGTEGYVIGQAISNMLCVYPSFFSVYGGSVPVVSLVIPEHAVLKPVDPALSWGEKPEGEWIQTAQMLELKLAEGAVEKWNLSLGGDLTMNFYAQIQAEDLSAVEAVITVADKTDTIALSDSAYDGNQGAYPLQTKLAAAQMCDEISVQLLYSGVKMWEKTYTVEQYAQTVLSDDSMSSYHRLIREMLNYGGAAQDYFDYYTDHLVSEGMTGVGTEPIPAAAEQEVTVEGNAEGIRFYGASLSFRDRIAVRFYYAVSGDPSDCRVICGGKAYSLMQSGDYYYVEISGILPQDLDKTVTVTVNDTLTVAYSPMHYMVRMNTKGSDSLKQLLKALYNYHLAAKALSS